MTIKKSKKEVGRIFEAECVPFLETMFDKVVWLSKDKKSSYDFLCFRGDEILKGDAKVCNVSKKAYLKYSQKDADFVVVKWKNGFEFLSRKNFGNKVEIKKDCQMTTISISKKDLAHLEKWKEKMRKIGVGAVVESMINLIKYNKMEGDMK